MKITNNARTYTNFNNSFGFKINKLSKELKRYSAKMIGEFKDLGIPELFTLNVIGDAHKDVTIKYITTVHWADQAEISRGVKKLIELDLIEKKLNKKDKRFSLLTITPKGEKIHKDIVKRQKDRNQKLLKDFKDTEIVILQKLLDKLLISSQKYLIVN
jgi:DNA-binding MarR family transcriptional regulator